MMMMMQKKRKNHCSAQSVIFGMVFHELIEDSMIYCPALAGCLDEWVELVCAPFDYVCVSTGNCLKK